MYKIISKSINNKNRKERVAHRIDLFIVISIIICCCFFAFCCWYRCGIFVFCSLSFIFQQRISIFFTEFFSLPFFLFFSLCSVLRRECGCINCSSCFENKSYCMWQKKKKKRKRKKGKKETKKTHRSMPRRKCIDKDQYPSGI